MGRISKTELEKAVNEVFDKNKNTIDLDKCSGFVLYTLSTLLFTKKCKEDKSEPYIIQDIGKGISSTFSRLYCDHKVIGAKFHLIDDGYDKTLDYLNNGSNELKITMLDYIENLRSNYHKEKEPYDMGAIILFFTLKNPKLKFTIEGENVLSK